MAKAKQKLEDKHPSFRTGQQANLPGPGPGRPKGFKPVTDLRKAVIEALENKGGVQYLMNLADEHPKAFASLVAKAMPQELKAELRVVNQDLLNLLQERRKRLAEARGEVIEDAEVVDVTDEP